MDQGDWKTDLLSLDPSSPERPAEQSPQNLKKEIIRLKTLCTHMDMRISTFQLGLTVMIVAVFFIT